MTSEAPHPDNREDGIAALAEALHDTDWKNHPTARFLRNICPGPDSHRERAAAILAHKVRDAIPAEPLDVEDVRALVAGFGMSSFRLNHYATDMAARAAYERLRAALAASRERTDGDREAGITALAGALGGQEPQYDHEVQRDEQGVSCCVEHAEEDLQAFHDEPLDVERYATARAYLAREHETPGEPE